MRADRSYWPARRVGRNVVYGFGWIDASGRVADRATITALGWRGGDRLTLTADAGVMVAHRDLGGMVTVPSRPYIVIPAALRRRCGLRAGDRVLLAASPGQDTSTPERAKAVIPRPSHPRLHAVLLCPLCPFSFLILISRSATLEAWFLAVPHPCTI